MSYESECGEARIDWTHCAIMALTTMVVFCVSLAAAGQLLRTGDIDERWVDRSTIASDASERRAATYGDFDLRHAEPSSSARSRDDWAKHDSRTAVPLERTMQLVAAERPAAERPGEKMDR